MKRLCAFVLICLFSANPLMAGPLADAIAKAGKQAPAAPVRTGENKLLWPGITLIAAGAGVALYGFTHTSGASIETNNSGTSIDINEKKSTGVGFAGLAIAGVGGFLLYKGANDAKRTSVAIGPRVVQVKVRF